MFQKRSMISLSMIAALGIGLSSPDILSAEEVWGGLYGQYAVGDAGSAKLYSLPNTAVFVCKAEDALICADIAGGDNDLVNQNTRDTTGATYLYTNEEGLFRFDLDEPGEYSVFTNSPEGETLKWDFQYTRPGDNLIFAPAGDQQRVIGTIATPTYQYFGLMAGE